MTYYISARLDDGTAVWRMAGTGQDFAQVDGLPDPANLALGTAMNATEALSTLSAQNIPTSAIVEAIQIVGGPVQTNATYGLAQNANIPIVVVSAPATSSGVSAPATSSGVATPATSSGVATPATSSGVPIATTTQTPGFSIVPNPVNTSAPANTSITISQPSSTNFDISKIFTGKNIAIAGAIVGVFLLIVALIFRGRGK